MGMGLRIIFGLLTIALVARAFTIVGPSWKPLGSDKIPEYIGLGYNVLKGNPFTNHIDEGFRSTIFQMDYSKGQRTEDGKYVIPDFTHSAETISCSLESKVSEYTGSENYQK